LLQGFICGTDTPTPMTKGMSPQRLLEGKKRMGTDDYYFHDK